MKNVRIAHDNLVDNGLHLRGNRLLFAVAHLLSFGEDVFLSRGHSLPFGNDLILAAVTEQLSLEYVFGRGCRATKASFCIASCRLCRRMSNIKKRGSLWRSEIADIKRGCNGTEVMMSCAEGVQDRN